MGMKAILLAATPGNVWDAPIHRHLVSVAGEPQIGRTLRQLKERGIETVVATSMSHLYEVIKSYGATRFPQGRCASQSAAALETKPLWNGADQVAILLGDVVFSDQTMDLIARELTSPASFYGTATEMFGMNFRASEFDAMENAFRKAGPLNVWLAYRAYCGFRPDEYVFDDRGMFVFIQDYTAEFDRPSDYLNWLRPNPWALVEGGRPPRHQPPPLFMVPANARETRMWRVKTGKRVYYSGCWDLLHIGHVNALRRAKQHGDYLIVGVLTDEFVKSYKGKCPVISCEQRMEMVAALGFVDEIVRSEGIDDLDLLLDVNATVRAVGPEYGKQHPHQVEMLEEMKEIGTEVVRIPRPLLGVDISSYAIKERIVNREK